MRDPIHIPARSTPTALVVWLHGLGASGDDFVPIVPMMQLPHVHWVFPHAPIQPVTINGGMAMPSWYDIKHMTPGPGREDTDQLRDSAKHIDALIQRTLARHNIPASRVVIAGFSQGGAVAMEMLTHGPRTFAGGVILSSYWATSDSDPTDTNASTPVFFGHGTHDPVVPHARGRAAYEALLAAERPVTFSDWPMAHEVCVPELQDIAKALGTWLP